MLFGSSTVKYEYIIFQFLKIKNIENSGAEYKSQPQYLEQGPEFGLPLCTH
jgi:hypothetical protein